MSNPGLPPFLLIHGTEDEAVPYDQSVKFAAQLKAAGVPCDFYTVQDGIHGVINWEKNPDQHAYKAILVDWLRKTLAKRYVWGILQSLLSNRDSAAIPIQRINRRRAEMAELAMTI